MFPVPAGELLRVTGEHLFLTGTSVAIAVLIGVPAGIYCASSPRAGRIILRLTDIVQTVPSLALFGFLIPLPLIGGIGVRTAMVALVLYSLLPIVRNTLLGIRGIDPLVREAGLTLGFTRRELLLEVELPLAAPVIIGGVRIALVVGIGLATIAAFVGGGGLGELILRGVAMVDGNLILAGALPAALLALAADAGFSALERALARRTGMTA